MPFQCELSISRMYKYEKPYSHTFNASIKIVFSIETIDICIFLTLSWYLLWMQSLRLLVFRSNQLAFWKGFVGMLKLNGIWSIISSKVLFMFSSSNDTIIFKNKIVRSSKELQIEVNYLSYNIMIKLLFISNLKNLPWFGCLRPFSTEFHED